MEKDKILIVDDEEYAVRPLLKLMEKQGFEVAVAFDGTEGVEKFANEKFDLILLDVAMPKMNGYEFLTKIKEDFPDQNVPVIFVTGHFNENEIVRGLEMGAVDVVSKPYKIHELIARSRIRIAEARQKKEFTPISFFFNEAQEKELGKRSGLFEFYDKSKTRIGEIYVETGKIVYATSKDAIKEDAFLHLACQPDAAFTFKENVEPPARTLAVPITSMILEAAKLLDQIEKREARNEDEKRVIIIDRDRIPRILASRALRAEGFTTMVTSPSELDEAWLKRYDPDVLVIDYVDGMTILSKLDRYFSEKKVPVVIYSSKEAERNNDFDAYPVSGFVDKNQMSQLLGPAIRKALT